MADPDMRLTDKVVRPDSTIISAWIGQANFKRWTAIVEFIERTWPGVFPADDWVYGGRKYGWGLRFKKTRSFCILIPERKRLLLVIVMGKAEREQFEAMAGELSPSVREAYDAARTYMDGKWVALPLDRDALLEDVRRLLVMKRKPKGQSRE